MKQLIFILTLGGLSLSLSGQYRCQDLKQNLQAAADTVISIENNAKSDSFDILSYELHLDFSQLPNRYLQGKADIKVSPKMAHSGIINLDLLILQVDSILQDGQSISYTHNDTIVKANLSGNPTPSDTFTLSVYYHGNPPGDGSGWGGWHSQNGYFYNLGVGFAANPHTYGRAWHPCFDNFVEKATYEFYIKTRTPRRPYCNGLRISETSLAGDTILTNWSMTDPIPTYLASVAISNYAEILDTVQAINGIIPIQLMAKPNDSLKLVNSFQNLKGSFQSFEQAFGPYHWQKVGYAATTVGAMEHATSIHYPTNLINGNLSGEDIMAHELAHHWWGNLVTCETDKDMWINEGMAEFCSHLYREDVYGRQNYLDAVRQNAYNVLEQAHKSDDGYKAIQGLSHEYVYGYHVYQKGAMVAHNLRGYLGDSLFFNGLTSLLNNNKYGNLNSNEFRDQLSQITGVNLHDFFDDWVFNPGFASVWVDSIHNAPTGAYVRIRQGLHHAPSPYNSMPVKVTFFDSNGNTETRDLILNGMTSGASFQNLAFQPAFAIASYNGEILTADTHDEYDSNSNFTDQYSKITLTPENSTSSSKIIAVHHWAGPKGKIPAWADYHLSPNRFWTIQFTDTSDLFSGRINFNGTNLGMDQDLLSHTGDSLMVMYRKDGSHYWEIWPYQNKQVFGSPGNILGYFELDSIKPGDYVLANTDESISLPEPKLKKGSLDIFPNPAKNRLYFKFPEDYPSEVPVQIRDVSGKLIYDKTQPLNSRNLQIKLEKLRSEYVIVRVGDYQEKIWLTR